jgi:hypothetical protein
VLNKKPTFTTDSKYNMAGSCHPPGKIRIACTVFKNLLCTYLKTFIYIATISIVLFLCSDLLLGRFYPKIHTPTKYGWSLAPNSKKSWAVHDTKGNYRKVENEYFDHGFKRWPKDPGDKPRVLIIGDSFTEMDYVSNGEEWYAYLELAFPDIAFYVFGAGGYGTLQEYMVMDDHFDTVMPDAIIWLFCDNDYSNNYYELDKREYPYNNHFVRPYWEDNAIVYRLPLPYPQLRKYSFSADRLLHIYDKIRRKIASQNWAKFIQIWIESQNKRPFAKKQYARRDQYMSKAINVTKLLARKIRSRAGDIPIYFFTPYVKFTSENRSICEAGNFRGSDALSEQMAKILMSSIQLLVVNDGHWNYSGNRHAGEILSEYFKSIGGIVPSGQRHRYDHQRFEQD